MSEKVGVYICHCGSNIAGVIDVEALAKWAGENLEGVAVSKEYKFMCSSLGQQLIEDDIKEHKLTRIVVGACSPHLHEKTFRRACINGGLNPYLLQMASLREQISWVSDDQEKALEKAGITVNKNGAPKTRKTHLGNSTPKSVSPIDNLGIVTRPARLVVVRRGPDALGSRCR